LEHIAVSETSETASEPVVVTAGSGAGSPPTKGGTAMLLDLSKIDLSQRMIEHDDLEYWLPHRGTMLMLDAVVWHSDDCADGLAIRQIHEEEFWVPGHFPDRPILPGVLMIEAAAQLSCVLFNKGLGRPTMPSFLRIKHASFRNVVVPGDTLYLHCRVTKGGRRRFVCDIQGTVDDRIAFDAEITGMSVGDIKE